MKYSILFLPAARKALGKLPKADQMRVDRHILELADDPRPPGAIPLKGAAKGLWRVRVGDWRIVYQIEDRQLVVLVVSVAHRREVYRDL